MNIAKSDFATADLILSGRLTIDRVWEAKKMVLAALLAQPEVTVCLKGVEEVDLSFLQMLCAARKLARERNQKLHVLGCKQEAIEAAVTRYGFCDLPRCLEACGSCLWS